jgi:hypothetical protein
MGSRMPVDCASAPSPLLAESLIQVLSDNAEKMSWYPIAHEPYVLSLVRRHMFQGTGKSFTKIKRWYTLLVSLLDKTMEPKGFIA